MIKKRYPYGALSIFVGISIASLYLIIFLPPKAIRQEGKLYVVCTTGILADMVASIGGSHVQVDYLMGPGVDPHIYRARESDMHKLAQADIVFYHGLHLEGKMATVFEHMRSGADMVAVSDAIPHELLRSVEENRTVYDPHVWHDVALWQYAVGSIGDALTKKDKNHSKEYQEGARQYKADLAELDTYIRTCVATIPDKQRILITAHDAFGYFGKAYGFEVVGLQGISTDLEISTHDIKRVADIIVTYDVRALFVESLIPQRTLEAVRHAVAAHHKKVDFGEELFSDALGDEASGAHTYINMMKHNIEALVSALSE